MIGTLGYLLNRTPEEEPAFHAIIGNKMMELIRDEK